MQAPRLFIMADIAIPDAWQCFIWLAPFVTLAASIYLLRRMDLIMDRLFPHWEWERQLGWLNLAAQRRADRVLRWLGYFVYAVLGLTLLGIVWAAKGLSNFNNSDDPHVLLDLLIRIPVLLVSLLFWALYLGCELIPKLTGQYEEEELEKFRAEQAELELEREQNPSSRLKSPLHKAGANPLITPNRPRRR